MIGLIVLLMLVIGVPAFAVVAVVALHAYARAELDPALLVIGFSDLGDHVQLLAVPLISFVVAMLGREEWRRWAHFLASSADRVRPGPNPATLFWPLLFALAAACAVAVSLIVPAILYSVIAAVAAPWCAVSAEALVVAALVPVTLVMAVVACLPGLERYLKRVSPPASAEAPGAGRHLSDLLVALLVVGGVVAGRATVVDVALLGTVWMVVTRLFVFRELTWRQLLAKANRAVIASAVILLIAGLAMPWAAMVNDAGLLRAMGEAFGPAPGSQIAFLVVLNLLLLSAGLLLGVQVGVMLLTPLVVPLGLWFGLEGVHLGVVCLAGLLIGRALVPLARSVTHCVPGDRGDALLAGLRVLSLPVVLILLLVSGAPMLMAWLVH